MATLNLSLLPKTLTPNLKTLSPLLSSPSTSSLSFLHCAPPYPTKSRTAAFPAVRALADGEYSAKRSSNNEERETIMLPGCDYNHWLIVMEFPKDPAPTREQMIDTYLNTLATVLGSYYSKRKGLPGVLWVLPDSYIDVKNKDYGGDKYINGEIIPCQYPTYQPKQNRGSKYKSKAYVRQRDGPPAERRKPRQEATPESAS
ncbi:hypothetical protein DH2020_041817 [Rehmannia glutinosa]|uniref:MORF/ORRM1/DAG-like MORF domain-containing protein n=1 Tax=Rehmannia glutinosa TaxID=99300 RepID=A0ABR0UR60_REHGL